jgi:cell wall-associated NlpC family hydrolase
LSHWASTYIGKPWVTPNGCWTHVREVFANHYGIDLPEIANSGNASAIRAASDDSGMRPAPLNAKPQDGDLCIMRSPLRLHAGVCVIANGQIGVLHSTRETGVVWQSWREATEGMTVQLWRRHV